MLVADDDDRNQAPPPPDGDQGDRPRNLHPLIERGIAKAKALTKNAGAVTLIVVAMLCGTVLVLGLTDRLCVVGGISQDGIGEIILKNPKDKCPAPTPPNPGPPVPGPDVPPEPGPGPTPPARERTLREIQAQFARILDQLRREHGLGPDTVPTVAFRKTLQDRIEEAGGLLEDLYAVGRARADLGFEAGAERKATTPGASQPSRCRVYSKQELAGQWVLIRASNGQQIVRRAMGGIVDQADVYTDLHLNVEDGLRLGIDQSGVPENYSRVWVSFAEEADRDANPCP